MTNNTEILRTEGLKRSYLVNETKIDVLKGINLTINNQEFIAIMGKSGSGKTTLLKLLGMLDRPTEGKVFFKGEDSNSLRGDRLAMIRRREIGFIYQDYYLMDSLSVRENYHAAEDSGSQSSRREYNGSRKTGRYYGRSSFAG